MATEAAIVTGVFPDVTFSTDDWTATSFGTPTCAFIVGSPANATNNPQDGGGISVGAHDGTDDFCAFSFDEHGQGTTDSNRRNDGARSFSTYDTGKANIVEADAALITDGIRVTTQAQGPTLQGDAYGHALVLKGTLNEKLIKVALGTGTSAITVTPSFAADLLIAFSAGVGDSATSTHGIVSIGFAHNSSGGINQGCYHIGTRDAQAAGDTFHEVRDGEIAASTNLVGGNSWTATVSNFTATTFDVTPSSSAGNDYLYVLAIELADQDDAYVGIIDSNTSASTKAYTGTGFTPDAIVIAGGIETAVDTINSTGGSMFVGMADDTRERASVLCMEDGAATSNTSARKADTVVDVRFDDDTADGLATLSSFDSDGFTLNYSNGTASVRKWLALAIGDSTAAGGTTYDRTVSESLSFADTDNRTATFARDVAEALSFSDTVSRDATFNRLVAETLSYTDDVTGIAGTARNVSETLDFTDTVNAQVTYARLVSETLSFTDTATRTAVYARAISESLEFLDTVSSAGGETPEVEVTTKGGQSMTLAKMRRMERQQLLAMIREDDEVIVALLSDLLKRNKRLQ